MGLTIKIYFIREGCAIHAGPFLVRKPIWRFFHVSGSFILSVSYRWLCGQGFGQFLKTTSFRTFPQFFCTFPPIMFV
ncbi:hypothetical protein CJD36_011170 [Flavipsychrobacter stenotrophus]|uniref:Uncharacterized protein n=1 Tax=Flavipsychrobacter stenotrophus TaxID=2077091 RepID=A0A2S7SUY3_9BACT|nr:hypothetical protein CJD36_011170 [Flavipsychrobacter stenotrophus]